MGILLKWKKPDTETSYDKVKIYKSATENGPYTEVVTQPIEDNSFYDSSGSGGHWYKIRFYDSIGDTYSNYSDKRKGGVFYGYCSVEDVRNVTSLKESNVSDTQLAGLIEFAGAQLNSDINIIREDERVNYISDTKENEVDGTNLKYFTKHYPVGDLNDDFRVTADDFEVYVIDTKTGFKEHLQVNQINSKTGEFRLNRAPKETEELYVTYVQAPVRVDPPDQKIKMACILLSAAWAYSKLNIGKADRFHMGSITVFRDNDAYHQYYKRYTKILTQINSTSYPGVSEEEDM